MKPLSSSARTVNLGAIDDPIAQQALAYCRKQTESVVLVGGSVRDLLLGRETHDLDLVLPNNALSLAKRVADALGGAFVAMDAERDVGRVVLASPARPVAIIDVAAWRAGSLDEDLLLRDFTINALAVPLAQASTVIDVTGGLKDLDQRLLRMTSAHSFEDDPLRMLRAVRLLAELAPWGFRLDADTAEQVRLHASALASCSAERIRDELVRILACERPDTWLRLLEDLALLPIVLPELDALRGVSQSYPHRWDVFEHTIRTVAHVAWIQAWLNEAVTPTAAGDTSVCEVLSPYRNRLAAHFAQGEGDWLRSRSHLLRWAALCHDWGKPETRSVMHQDGDVAPYIQFIGHEQRGAELTQLALRQLRFNEVAVRRTSAIVAHHMRPLLLANEDQPLSARAVFRYYRDLDDAGVDVALLSLSDLSATGGIEPGSDVWQRVMSVTARLLHDYFDRRKEAVAPPALVDGNDLMTALRLPPGPLVGQLLLATAEAQAAGEVHTAQEALAYAARLAAQSMEQHNPAARQVVS